MGVPGFFGWLLRHYKENKIIKQKLDIPVNVLYIDANCLIHPQTKVILDNYPNVANINKLENNMCMRIENYFNYLLAFCQPTDEIYIAIDGSAPLAKISQQRKRRVRAIEDIQIRNNIRKFFNHLPQFHGKIANFSIKANILCRPFFYKWSRQIPHI